MIQLKFVLSERRLICKFNFATYNLRIHQNVVFLIKTPKLLAALSFKAILSCERVEWIATYNVQTYTCA